MSRMIEGGLPPDSQGVRLRKMYDCQIQKEPNEFEEPLLPKSVERIPLRLGAETHPDFLLPKAYSQEDMAKILGNTISTNDREITWDGERPNLMEGVILKRRWRPFHYRFHGENRYGRFELKIMGLFSWFLLWFRYIEVSRFELRRDFYLAKGQVEILEKFNAD